ncbi:hypothetical protein [Streptomyces collinus]|uniref:hypothetical protein n=1 Tax=Streptomyces collinus TaxID=42684 RepID=UPI003435878F
MLSWDAHSLPLRSPRGTDLEPAFPGLRFGVAPHPSKARRATPEFTDPALQTVSVAA